MTGRRERRINQHRGTSLPDGMPGKGVELDRDPASVALDALQGLRDEFPDDGLTRVAEIGEGGAWTSSLSERPMQALASDLPYRLREMPACLPVPRRSALAAARSKGLRWSFAYRTSLTFHVEPLPAALGAGTCPFLASKRLEPENLLPPGCLPSNSTTASHCTRSRRSTGGA